MANIPRAMTVDLINHLTGQTVVDTIRKGAIHVAQNLVCL